MLRVVNDDPPAVVQVISFTVLKESAFEDKSTREGKRWQAAVQHIQEQYGWIRTLYGHNMSASHKVDMYIIWTTFAAVDAFTSTPTFEAMLAGVAVSQLQHYCFGLQGDLPARRPIEIMTLSLPLETELQNQDLLGRQLENCKRLGLNVAYGWIANQGQGGFMSSKGLVMITQWESLDQMYEVKQSKDYLLIEYLKSLKTEASTSSSTGHYMALREPDMRNSRKSRCTIM